MEFTGKNLLSFSDRATAQSLFSDEALKGVVAASYGVDMAGLTGTATARFDRLQITPFPGAVSTEIVSGHQATHRGNGAGGASSGRDPMIDVLWSGAVTVAAAFPKAEIALDRASVPDLSGIDAAIPAPAPTAPAALEAARRAVLLDRLRAGAEDADAVTEALLDAWLAEAGLASVTEFLDRAAAAAVPMRQFVLSFSPLPGTAAPAPVTFPVAAAALIRDITAADFRLADLFFASRTAQARLDVEGVTPHSGAAGLPRGRPAILWVVLDSWFDDADWPGGDTGPVAARRAARITVATRWLATQGIALVPVPG